MNYYILRVASQIVELINSLDYIMDRDYTLLIVYNDLKEHNGAYVKSYFEKNRFFKEEVDEILKTL